LWSVDFVRFPAHSLHRSNSLLNQNFLKFVIDAG